MDRSLLFVCDCGDVLTKHAKGYHMYSRKHFENLKNKDEKIRVKKMEEELAIYKNFYQLMGKSLGDIK